MKKAFYTTLLVITFGLSQISNAQITLEHTFANERVSFNIGIVDGELNCFQDAATYPENGYYYSEIVNNSYRIKTYNADYSVNSNQTYTFTPPTGYQVSSVAASKKLFNDDDNYEFIVTFYKTNPVGYDNDSYRVALYDVNGSVLKNFGSGCYVYVYPMLFIVDNHYKLLVYRSLYDAGNNNLTSTEIYAVPGDPSAGVTGATVPNPITPYPNPASTTISLPYNLRQGVASEMHIFDDSGKLIETKQIDAVFDKILLNVSNYAKGVYLYEVDGVSSRFVVY